MGKNLHWTNPGYYWGFRTKPANFGSLKINILSNIGLKLLCAPPPTPVLDTREVTFV